RLHKLQATREIHIIPKQPAVISFSMRNAPSVIKITKKRAMNMLQANSKGTAEDNYNLSQLYQLPEDEILAYRKVVPPKPVANIAAGDEKMAKNAVIPIMYADEGIKTAVKANQSIMPGSRQVHRRK